MGEKEDLKVNDGHTYTFHSKVRTPILDAVKCIRLA